MKPTLSPIGRARLMVTALVVVMVTAFFPASQPARPRLPPKGEGDAYLHLATIERIRAGDRYYDAVGEELRRGRYPATHVFNWRTPAHFVAVATLSVPVARVILKVLAFIALGLTMLALARESRAVLVIGAIAQLGAVATAFRPMAVGVSEVWAGVFIALSLCAYVKRWWTAAAVLGIAAVFTRELAAPYCVACAERLDRAGAALGSGAVYGAGACGGHVTASSASGGSAAADLLRSVRLRRAAVQ
ncbi:MAG: hypothetical protein LC753_18735 [Acidobacteria bacterium]|nr:hypothetical protein [Acidobacteriota bacterium]